MPATRVPQVRTIEFRREQVGMGFNSDSGLALSSPFVNLQTQPNPNAPGIETIAGISMVSSHETLMQVIGMSLEAGGRYGFFGAGGKGDYVEKTSYNSISAFLVARCVVKTPILRGIDWQISPQAQALLTPAGMDRFKRAYGDSFVRGVQRGGEYYAVARVTCTSRSTLNDLTATLQAEFNALVAAGSFKAKYNRALESASMQVEYNISTFQRGGSGGSGNSSGSVSIEDVIQRFRNFPQIAAANPFPYETEVATYDTIALDVPTPEEEEDFLRCLRKPRKKRCAISKSGTTWNSQGSDLIFMSIHLMQKRSRGPYSPTRI